MHLTSNGHVGNVLDGIMAEGFDFDNSLFYVLDSIKIRPGKWVRQQIINKNQASNHHTWYGKGTIFLTNSNTQVQIHH